MNQNIVNAMHKAIDKLAKQTTDGIEPGIRLDIKTVRLHRVHYTSREHGPVESIHASANVQLTFTSTVNVENYPIV